MVTGYVGLKPGTGSVNSDSIPELTGAKEGANVAAPLKFTWYALDTVESATDCGEEALWDSVPRSELIEWLALNETGSAPAVDE